MPTMQEISDAVIIGNQQKTIELVEAALKEGKKPGAIITEGLIPGMDTVGKKFTAREYYVPDMLIAARAMQSALKILKPMLVGDEIVSAGTCVIGTVQGDLHDIGKNLVGMMLEGAGFKVIDLGADVKSEKYIEAIKENSANVLGLSALLTTTMPMMKEVVEATKSAGIRDKVKIVIGGAPITQKYADDIGADGYSPDAASAVDLVKGLIK
ncbi:MAG: methyltransferase [Omnitrophica WOR_2 bacterium RBG_13_44_8]|nr:MAG: methyltransferase [Omnitrophica WOR_2 bacterium RBG_13_44_8]